MPVELASIHGKVDYDVERALRDLAAAVNQLEASSSAQTLQTLMQAVGAVQSSLSRVTQRVDDLLRRVAALEAAP